jgi:hypothetical protein
MKNSCEGIGDETAMLAFIGALNRGGLLRHTLTREKDARILTLNRMIAIASSYAAADDDAGAALQAVAVPNQKKCNGNKRKNPPDDQHDGFDMVAMTFQQGGQGGG